MNLGINWVPMGCYDGAEVCELVGSYILNKLTTIMNIKDVGLYRDDGLGIFKNKSGPEIEKTKKGIVRIFKDCGLKITVKTNQTSVDFLDVRFDLKENTYKPYRKPNNNPIYINKQSNHPPNIIKQLPTSIEKRISGISCNEEVFRSSKEIYENALKSSGFTVNLKYNEGNANQNENSEKKKRKRKIIWFNPPFSLNVKTHIGKQFFKILHKHFPKNHSLYKIFNKNTVKLSYSCTRNITSIITSHNKNILKPNKEIYGCNCRVKEDCPLDNKCLTPKVIYEANVTNTVDNEEKIYIGLTENKFKERYSNHKSSFRYDKYKNSTELSKYVWQLQDQNKIPIIKWRIIKVINSNIKSDFCKLCLFEKYYILKALGDERVLNRRSEFISKCRHQNKLVLKNIKTK